MTAVSPSIIEIEPDDVEEMVKRLFKVAEVLTRHAPDGGDIVSEKSRKNHDPQEIVYRESEDLPRQA